MDITKAIKALSNDNRMQILRWLNEPKKHFKSSTCDIADYGVCVGLIEEKINLSQSTVSQYLQQLHDAGFITMERRGQWTYCKRNNQFVKQFTKELANSL